MNLLCGALGRLLLTISTESSQAANELRVKSVNVFKGHNFKDAKAPCVRELSFYLKLDEAEDEFY